MLAQEFKDLRYFLIMVESFLCIGNDVIQLCNCILSYTSDKYIMEKLLQVPKISCHSKLIFHMGKVDRLAYKG